MHCEFEQKPPLANGSIKVLGLWNEKGDVLMMDEWKHVFAYNLESGGLYEVGFDGWEEGPGVDTRLLHKSNKMITLRRLCFLILPSLCGLVIICLLISFWVANIKDEKEVGIMINKTHQEIGLVIQKATTTLLLMNSSATNLAKIVSRSLGETDVTFSHIQAKVAPLLFEALLTIPRVSQISYIQKDGLFFALHSQADQQIFAVYSNVSSSKHLSARISYSWYTQRVDYDTGKLYGQVVLFPTLVNETWLQQALSTTNGSTMLGNSWTDDKNPLVLNIARVDHIGVVSLGFELKSLLNVFSGIKPFGGGLYLATKDGKVVSDGIPNTRVIIEENATIYFQILEAGEDIVTLRLNYEMPKAYFFKVKGTKYVVYLSSLDIIGMQTVYVLALPYDKVQSKIHRNLVMVSVLSSLMIVTIIISFMLTMKSTTNEMWLRTALMKQVEVTQQLERKSKNRSVAFETASHDIRASLAAISGTVELSISEKHQGAELATDLRIVESSTKYLQGLLNSILDTSKIEAGKMDLEEQPFDLVKTLENVVDMFYPVGLKKQVDVILDLQVVSVCVRARAVNSAAQSPVTGSGCQNRLQRCQSVLCFGKLDACSGDIEAGGEVSGEFNRMDFVFEVSDTGIGIAKEKRDSVFENYFQVKGSEHEFEGNGLGLAIVQSLVRLMSGEISIVDKEPDEKGTCFRFNVIFKVSQSDPIISEDQKTSTSSGSNTGSYTPFCSPIRKDSNPTTVVLFISCDERRKVSQKFLQAHRLKVFATKTIHELSETLKELKQPVSKPCSPGSYLNLGIGYLRPGRSPGPKRSPGPSKSPRPSRSPKNVPLSALDGTDVLPAQMNNWAFLPGFILLVVDTARADFRELCKVVAEFRKDSKDVCFRVVWLGLRCMQAHDLNEEQLPLTDVVLPMPLHGSRLYSLIDMLPEFGDMMNRTPPHANRGTPERVFWKNGVVFDTCTNGQEALTFVSKGLTDQRDLGASHILPYDYILMDCQMPVMDGCEATRHIRLMEKDYGVRIPIIGLTAHEEGEELNRFLKELDIHVSKPLNEHKLLKVIEDLHSRN
ncbi:histidine kinase CKI1-like [Bidens hawaiensis]|uniref:histidine kinase CKI1-like n=1 Tax=Bidens hawaiensis TaxID=980011 RepID=UPI00404B2849